MRSVDLKDANKLQLLRVRRREWERYLTVQRPASTAIYSWLRSVWKNNSQFTFTPNSML